MNLAKRAQAYAEYLLLYNELEHDEFRNFNGSGKEVGENLYKSSSTSSNSSDAVTMWYANCFSCMRIDYRGHYSAIFNYDSALCN